MKSSLILLSFIKIQEGGLNFTIFLDQLTWNDPYIKPLNLTPILNPCMKPLNLSCTPNVNKVLKKKNENWCNDLKLATTNTKVTKVRGKRKTIGIPYLRHIYYATRMTRIE